MNGPIPEHPPRPSANRRSASIVIKTSCPCRLREAQGLQNLTATANVVRPAPSVRFLRCRSLSVSRHRIQTFVFGLRAESGAGLSLHSSFGAPRVAAGNVNVQDPQDRRPRGPLLFQRPQRLGLGRSHGDRDAADSDHHRAAGHQQQRDRPLCRQRLRDAPQGGPEDGRAQAGTCRIVVPPLTRHGRVQAALRRQVPRRHAAHGR